MIHEAGEGDNVKNLAVVGGCSVIGLLVSVCVALRSCRARLCTALTPSPASSSTSSPTEKQRAVERTASSKNLGPSAARAASAAAVNVPAPASMPRGLCTPPPGPHAFHLCRGAAAAAHTALESNSRRKHLHKRWSRNACGKSTERASLHGSQKLAKRGAEGCFQRGRLELGGGFTAPGGNVDYWERVMCMRQRKEAGCCTCCGAAHKPKQTAEPRAGQAKLTGVGKHQRLRALLSAEKKALHHAWHGWA